MGRLRGRGTAGRDAGPESARKTDPKSGGRGGLAPRGRSGHPASGPLRACERRTRKTLSSRPPQWTRLATHPNPGRRNLLLRTTQNDSSPCTAVCSTPKGSRSSVPRSTPIVPFPRGAKISFPSALRCPAPPAATVESSSTRSATPGFRPWKRSRPGTTRLSWPWPEDSDRPGLRSPRSTTPRT